MAKAKKKVVRCTRCSAVLWSGTQEELDEVRGELEYVQFTCANTEFEDPRGPIREQIPEIDEDGDETGDFERNDDGSFKIKETPRPKGCTSVVTAR